MGEAREFVLALGWISLVAATAGFLQAFGVHPGPVYMLGGFLAGLYVADNWG